MKNIRIQALEGGLDLVVRKIAFDSRKVEKGDLFVAVRGTQVDGHEYIAKALDRGANAIVCEQLPENFKEYKDTVWIEVEDSAEALALASADYYGRPSDKLKLVGVTGTNGKTTSATLLYQLFTELGYKSALLSTVEVKIGEESVSATHTTPDALAINELMAKMVEAGCTHCFMEVSSHALVQKRVNGLSFDGAVFTNISHDHLDYHKTFPEYIAAKKLFFDMLSKKAFALVNKDDKRGMVMLQNCAARKHGFSMKGIGDFNAKIMEIGFEGMLLTLSGKEFWTKLTGGFNAYNLLGVYASALLLGEEEDEALAALSRIGGAPGRFEFVPNQSKIRAIVDYAHTPDALENVLKTIAKIRTGQEQVITVIGCGGNRDKDKRPKMAKTASEWSDKIILTSDNPRFEKAESIIEDMLPGIPVTKQRVTHCVTDRKEAIKLACALASEQDVVLVAGKGHEPYQEIEGVKYPFDDSLVLRDILNMTVGWDTQTEN